MRRYQRMGIGALLLAILILADSFVVSASDIDYSGDVLIIDSESGAEFNSEETGEANNGTGTEDDINGEEKKTEEKNDNIDEEIVIVSDRDDLRSLVDVDELSKKINEKELLERIDRQKLWESISEFELLSSMDEDTIRAEFEEKKAAGELDEYVILVEDKGDDFSIANHPVDVTNVQYPLVGERSPFDFIVDPQGLVYGTNAVKYGGGKVQESATVLFRNTEGEYVFSDTSDFLKIVNRSNVPVKVEIHASIAHSEQVEVVSDKSDLSGANPQIYMALTDGDEKMAALSEGKDAVLTAVIDPVPVGTYDYIWNEKKSEYDYVLSENADESKFDVYSFGVTAACNREGNWGGVTDIPKIVITWKAEPILTDWDSVNKQLEDKDKIAFDAFKKMKVYELKEAELEKLIEEKLEELRNEELEKLIEKEIDRLENENTIGGTYDSGGDLGRGDRQQD